MSQLGSSLEFTNDKTLAGMLGNISNPLTHIPMQRQNDALRLSGVETFTRSTGGTYIDSLDGLVKTAAPDVPRYERMADGGIGMLLEGAGNNIAPNNIGGVASGVTTIVSSPNADLFGTGFTGMQIPIDLAVGTQYWTSTGVTTVAGVHTASMWVQGRAGTLLRAKVYNNTTLVYGVETTHVMTGKPQRITAEQTFAIGELGYLSIFASTGFVTGDKIETFGYQLEALPFASSYMPSVGGTLGSRVADNYSIQVSGNFKSDELSWVVDYDLLGRISGKYQYLFEYGASGDSRAYEIIDVNESSFLTALSYFGTSNTTARPGTISVNTVRRLGMSNGQLSGLSLFNDGEKVVNAPHAVIPVFLSSTMYIGSRSDGSSSMYGHVRNFRIYDRALTDAEVGAA